MKIGILGAGAIGCYIGGRLASVDANVTFLCREKSFQTLSQNGLTISDSTHQKVCIPASQLNLTLDIADLIDCNIIFICVKSAATEQVANLLKQHLTHQKPILVSLQNGVGNTSILKSYLDQLLILEGMVPFNVAEMSPGHFHQGTQGTLMIRRFEQQQIFKELFDKTGLTVEFREDMHQVQWAKVLINLNNSINALSGLPLKEQLSNRTYRQCLALAQYEALYILSKAGIQPAKLMPLPAKFIPKILTLPNFWFGLISRSTLAVDPLARSSMQDDLQQGRRTEIDWINGEIVKLAKKIGLNAPINQCLIDLIKNVEKKVEPSHISAENLKHQLIQSQSNF